MKTISLFPLVAFLFASTLSAQQLTVRGVIEAGDEPGSHCLDGTDVVLTSSTVALDNFLRVNVELTGTWNESLADPAIEVTAISAMPPNFAITSSNIIGEPATFSVTGPVGAPAGTFYSRERGFHPFFGSMFLLDLGTVAPVGFGVVGADGIFESTINIPNNPALIGINAYGQGFWYESGLVKLTGTQCIRVLAP